IQQQADDAAEPPSSAIDEIVRYKGVPVSNLIRTRLSRQRRFGQPPTKQHGPVIEILLPTEFRFYRAHRNFRSEERRVGNEWVMTGRSWGSPYHYNKKKL